MTTVSALKAKMDFDAASKAVDEAMLRVRIQRDRAKLEALSAAMQTLQVANGQLIAAMERELTGQ
jgi:hypothetical protein